MRRPGARREYYVPSEVSRVCTNGHLGFGGFGRGRVLLVGAGCLVLLSLVKAVAWSWSRFGPGPGPGPGLLLVLVTFLVTDSIYPCFQGQTNFGAVWSRFGGV